MKGLVLLTLLVAGTALLAEGQNVNVVITGNADGTITLATSDVRPAIGTGSIGTGGNIFTGGNLATRAPIVTGGIIPGAINLVGNGLSAGINTIGNVLAAKTNFEGRTIYNGGTLGGNLAQSAGSLIGNAAAGLGSAVGSILGGVPRLGGAASLNAGARVAYQRPYAY
uniref:Uncharacterized protein n=1 Tax=Anopheles maculatus TaxID=74869 RepID=A0A182SJQ8_9DIPT